MPIGSTLQAWRLFRGHSIPALAEQAGLPSRSLEAIEAGELDPPVSVLEGLAAALGVPVPWLYGDPRQLALLYSDGEETQGVPEDSSDPVLDRLLRVSRADRELYVLLTALIQSGEPKLVRAAEMSLRSLLKQSRQTSVPWESRPPGHFEPPSD